MQLPFNTPHFTLVVKYYEKLMSIILTFHNVAIHLLFMLPTALLTHYLTGPK